MDLRVFIPSGAGSPGFGGISECLLQEKGVEVFAGDVQARAYGRNMASAFCTMPPSDHPDYLNAVIENGKRYQCQVLLPITTRELSLLSVSEALLGESGLSLAISPPGSLEVANNKARLYSFLQQHHLPCGDFEVVDNKTAFFEALKKLGFPQKNVIMKPASGNGSRGFRFICTESELQNDYFDSKAGTTKTSYAALQAELPDTFPYPMVVCEYLPGEEYSVDMIVDRGKTVAIAIRVREKTVSGISVRGTFVDDTEIEKQCRIISDNLDLHGPIGMQFKRDANGLCKMLEINPRLQGAVSTARYVGLNFPLLAVQLAIGVPLQIPEKRVGASFNRYWKDIEE